MNLTDMYNLISKARELKTSDIHLTVGLETMFRIHGHLTPCPVPLSPADVEDLILCMLTEQQAQLLAGGDDLDFALESPDGSRARVNIFRSKGNLGAVLRLLNTTVPNIKEMRLPPILSQFAAKPRGLILVTGPTGSGKSTTLAAMIQEINVTRAEHILTIEDPIEYVYPVAKSTIRQREVGRDVKDFNTALRSALREDPDIILVGEMRDYETISLALTAAETGHLVMGTLHTTSAPQTIDRIIDACPPHVQEQTRTMLASTIVGVVTQCLVPLAQGQGRVAATEIMVGTDAIRSLIRGNKVHQIVTTMQSSKAQGMITLNAHLAELVKRGIITKQDAEAKCTDTEELHRLI